MNIYDDDVFRMACDQFRVIADYLNIDKNHRDRLMFPKRAITVTLPVHRRDSRARHVDELEMRAVEFAVRRSERRSYSRPIEIIAHGT